MAAMCNCMYPPGDPRCCMNKTGGLLVGRVSYETSPSPWFVTPEPLPHRCPVCLGKGFVTGGFYATPTEMTGSTHSMAAVDECRTCKGRGIVWKDG